MITITNTRNDALVFISRMKERLKKTNDTTTKGYVFPLAEATDIVT